MREVEIRLRMLEHCLAGTKNRESERPHFVFNRNAAGDKALIMQKEWQRLLRFGCKALSISTRPVQAVWFDPIVDGPIGIHERHYKDHDAPQPGTKFKLHEAFLPGAELVIRAVLRYPLKPETFKKILTAGGRFAGLTLHSFGEYGRFEVLSVK